MDCVAPPLGLVGWWPGDGSTNNLAQDHVGILDNAAYGPGLVGQAFAFVGFNSFLYVPFNGTFAALPNALSLEAWVLLNRTDVTSIPQRFMTLTPDNAVLAYVNGQFNFSLSLGPNSPSSFHMLMAPKAVAPRQWYHLAATYDGNVQSLYLNGSLAASAPVGPPIVPIGQGAEPEIYLSFFGAQALDGMVDEAAVYNRALSAAEVQAHYAAGSAGMCKVPSFSQITVQFPEVTRVAVNGPPLRIQQIQASTNFCAWLPVATLTNFTGQAAVLDRGAGAFNKRFYRALAP
jgi:hypothetical protein